MAARLLLFVQQIVDASPTTGRSGRFCTESKERRSADWFGTHLGSRERRRRGRDRSSLRRSCGGTLANLRIDFRGGAVVLHGLCGGHSRATQRAATHATKTILARVLVPALHAKNCDFGNAVKVFGHGSSTPPVRCSGSSRVS